MSINIYDSQYLLHILPVNSSFYSFHPIESGEISQHIPRCGK